MREATGWPAPCRSGRRQPSRAGPRRPRRDRIPGEHAHDQGCAEDDERHREREAKQDQPRVALGRGGDGQHVVQAHHKVGDGDGPYGAPQGLGGLDVLFLVVAFDRELDRDDEQQDAACERQPGQLHDRLEHHGEGQPQAEGCNDAERDAHLALPFGERAARQCNDDSVVAREQDVDADDLEDGNGRLAVQAEGMLEPAEQFPGVARQFHHHAGAILSCSVSSYRNSAAKS